MSGFLRRFNSQSSLSSNGSSHRVRNSNSAISMDADEAKTLEKEDLLPTTAPDAKDESPASKADAPIVSSLGLKILCLLAFQNCFKNLLMRYVMKDKPDFLTSAAVIGVELVKLVLCVLYILIIDRRSIGSIVQYMIDDFKHAALLSIPAAAYSFQMSMEYVALSNLDASIFAVLVQSKLLTTATFSFMLMRKKFKYIQIVSLVLLTVGVMLINLNANNKEKDTDAAADMSKGVMATLGIALSSGFASVYTEKVIKAQRSNTVAKQNYSLAYMQVQLALVSLVILGIYAMIADWQRIRDDGILHNFTTGAFVSIVNSAVGGLTVAAVLKYADSVLKSYATAISVVMTGVLSMVLFGTTLNAIYFLGIINVVCAVLLYNGKNMDKFACS